MGREGLDKAKDFLATSPLTIGILMDYILASLPKNVYLYGVISKGRKGYEEYAEK